MKTALAPLPLREWLEAIVPDVFRTMLDLQATPGRAGARRAAGQRISGAIGIVGENLSGALYLHLSQPFAIQITALMLYGAEGTTPRDPEVNDLVGEFCNMIGGQFKSSLCNAGPSCAMSTPSIIRGSAFAIEANPRARKEILSFDCLAQALAVEVHLENQEL
jgi:chemotaxis protein CheX